MQIKVWLIGISPMVWRRFLVPNTCTLRELHGVIQVVMGWEGIHLYQFCLRSRRYGSCEISASSPDVTLAGLRLRKGARFVYEYDLNIPWRHEIRIEDHLPGEPGKAYPRCTGGDGTCPPEDCGGPGGYLAGQDEASSLDALEDLHTMADILRTVVIERRPEVLDDQDTRWQLEDAVDRSRARERARGQPFTRRSVNARLRKGEHLNLMHQQ
ncbi:MULTISPECIES: plasmid pRiA4b ORF-3 family protein [unclassified Acidiphilium]|nr:MULTISPECIES: plasmid pRiA4b ORF-3 family protein [unclassified Acidiphilium]KDM66705.1 hypothetical protein ACIDI_54c00150 [Acidiphilium sp. JA12-A1]